MSITGAPRPVRGIVDRARVSRLLDDAAQLVVLHAPSGYGKSVALASWATTTDRHGVWVRLVAGAEEPAGFVQQLAEALSSSGVAPPGHPFRQASAALTVEPDPWAFFRRGVIAIGERLTLAIDEAHVLEDGTAHGLLHVLADLPSLEVRLASRRSGPLTDPAAGIVVDAILVGIDTLRLTRAEVDRVLGAHSIQDRIEGILAHGGAPAVARLTVLGADRGGDEISPWSVADAADSLLRLRRGAWESGFIDFLAATSLPDAVSAPLARRLSGEPHAQALLERAESEGLGSWAVPTADSAALFVYASFFREALERDLRRRLPAAAVRRLVLEVARWELETGRPWPAFRRAVVCGDWGLASDVARQHWGDLLRYNAQVRGLFSEVSPIALAPHPLVTMLLAIVYNSQQAHRLRAVEYFLLAAYGARVGRRTASPPDRALLNVIETASMRVSGRSRQSVAAAGAAYEALRSMDVRERDLLGRNEPTAWNQTGLSLFYDGDTDRALESFRHSTAVSDAKGLSAGLQGLALAAGAQAVSGDLPDARVTVAEALRRDWPDGWIDGYPGSMLRIAQSFLALEDGAVDAADALLRRLDPHRPTIEHWPLLAHLDTLIGLHRADAEGARLRLESEMRHQRARHSSLRLIEARIRHTLVLSELARGDTTAAESVLVRGATDVRTAISRARIAIVGADPQRALRVLQSQADTTGSSRTRAEYLALTAAALALEEREPEAARPTLVRLAALLRERGQSVALALVPSPGLDAMLRTASADESLMELARAIANARGLALIAARPSAPRLTPRERAVARELARNESVASIATALSVSPNTVKTQLRGLYRKLEVRSRSEALRELAAYGLTDHP